MYQSLHLSSTSSPVRGSLEIAAHDAGSDDHSVGCHSPPSPPAFVSTGRRNTIGTFTAEPIVAEPQLHRASIESIVSAAVTERDAPAAPSQQPDTKTPPQECSLSRLATSLSPQQDTSWEPTPAPARRDTDVSPATPRPLNECPPLARTSPDGSSALASVARMSPAYVPDVPPAAYPDPSDSPGGGCLRATYLGVMERALCAPGDITLAKVTAAVHAAREAVAARCEEAVLTRMRTPWMPTPKQPTSSGLAAWDSRTWLEQVSSVLTRTSKLTLLKPQSPRMVTYIVGIALLIPLALEQSHLGESGLATLLAIAGILFVQSVAALRALLSESSE